jgi:N-acetylmuramoyl-L-alanine amidase
MAGKHVVQPGESPSQIAASYGFEDWLTIYQHADNASLRQKRSQPNAIFPGDVVAIPKLEPKVYILATGKRHRIVKPRPKVKLNVTVKDGAGEALAGKKFELRSPDLAEPIEGTTTGDGHAQCNPPIDLVEAQFVVWDSDDKTGIRHVWDVELAGLFAPETEQGLRQRLNNLGYHAGEKSKESDVEPDDDDEANGARSDPLSLAIAAFQQDMGLDVTGIIDDDTRARLVAEHGGT